MWFTAWFLIPVEKIPWFYEQALLHSIHMQMKLMKIAQAAFRFPNICLSLQIIFFKVICSWYLIALPLRSGTCWPRNDCKWCIRNIQLSPILLQHPTAVFISFRNDLHLWLSFCMKASVSCAAAGIYELNSTTCDQTVPQKICIAVTPVNVEIVSTSWSRPNGHVRTALFFK